MLLFACILICAAKFRVPNSIVPITFCTHIFVQKQAGNWRKAPGWAQGCKFCQPTLRSVLKRIQMMLAWRCSRVYARKPTRP